MSFYCFISFFKLNKLWIVLMQHVSFLILKECNKFRNRFYFKLISTKNSRVCTSNGNIIKVSFSVII